MLLIYFLYSANTKTGIRVVYIHIAYALITDISCYAAVVFYCFLLFLADYVYPVDWFTVRSEDKLFDWMTVNTELLQLMF